MKPADQIRSDQITSPFIELERGREKRETLHLFQPPRADQMPDPLQGQDQHSIYLGMPG